MTTNKQINFAPLFIGLVIIIIYALSSCSATGGYGCQGNKAMLTAGKGYTKFNK